MYMLNLGDKILMPTFCLKVYCFPGNWVCGRCICGQPILYVTALNSLVINIFSRTKYCIFCLFVKNKIFQKNGSESELWSDREGVYYPVLPVVRQPCYQVRHFNWPILAIYAVQLLYRSTELRPCKVRLLTDSQKKSNILFSTNKKNW